MVVDVVTVTSTTHGVYTVCTFIYNAITFTPHSCLTVRIPSASSALPCVSLCHTLMRKCLLPQHPRNSPLRPASPRPLCRAIPRQSLACPGDATSSPWLQLTGPAKQCACCRAGYRTASVRSGERDLAALYKAAWPTTARQRPGHARPAHPPSCTGATNNSQIVRGLNPGPITAQASTVTTRL